MTLIEDLRQQTEEAHRSLEKDLIGRIKRIASREDYLELLSLMYGFYSAMEDELLPFLRTHEDVDFSERRKAAWLIHDMETLGKAGDLKKCGVLPSIESQASALGAMYVLEGSTLGGPIIAKMIRQQLGIEGENGFTFFMSYGKDAPVMWQRFKDSLAKPFRADEHEAIIRAANETFITFRNWIEQYDAKNV